MFIRAETKLAGIILGLIIAAALSMRGFDSAVNGFENTQCALLGLREPQIWAEGDTQRGA